MGIIDKIEDKLSGSSKNGDQSKLEKQAMKEGRSSYENQGRSSYENQGRSSYENQGKSQGLSSGMGSGMGTGAAAGAMGGSGNPVSSGTKGSMADEYDRRAASGAGSGGYGSQSGMDKMRPNEPYDPYSSKGQRAAAAAGTGGAGYGAGNSGYGATDGRTAEQDYAGRQSADSDVTRSRHGGVMNSTSDNYSRGGRSMENHEAIPTAGGQKVGSSDPYSSSSSGGHHYGRDAALAGGAGAAGVGAYEMGKSHRDTDGMGSSGYSSATQPRSGDLSYPQGEVDRRNPQDVSYMKGTSHGHQSNPVGGTSGYSDSTPERSGTVRSSGNESTGSSSGAKEGMPGYTTERKLGGAYEAGYRDALAHIAAETK